MAGLRGIQNELGMVADPNTCDNIIRGVKTFGLRMARHNANAQAVAEFLEAQPGVERVWYAGLALPPGPRVGQDADERRARSALSWRTTPRPPALPTAPHPPHPGRQPGPWTRRSTSLGFSATTPREVPRASARREQYVTERVRRT